MRKMISVLLAGAIFASGASVHAASKTPAEQLDKILEGRVAGAPEDCLQMNNVQSTQNISKTAVVYKMAGGKIYVNTPTGGAEALDRDSVLVTDTHSPQLCSIDTVKLYDSGSRFQTGTLFLGKFVPYVKSAN